MRLLMTKKRRRRKLDQIIKVLQEGDAMLDVGRVFSSKEQLIRRAV